MAKEPQDSAAATPGAKPTRRKKEFRKKREKRLVPQGVAYVYATFNNTIITLSDPDGRVVSWSSAAPPASRVRARVRPTPRSRPPWPPPAWRVISMG